MGALIKTCCNLNKTVHVHKGFLYMFLQAISNSICYKCSAVALMGGGGGGIDRGAIFTFFFPICQDNIRSFLPIREALPRRGRIQEKRRRNQHHNYCIMEHDILI